MLSPHQLAAHLLSRDLLTSDVVVNRGLTFTDRSRRNRNFEISTARGTGYFTKQAPTAGGKLDREATIYGLLNVDDRGKELARYLPPFCHYDDDQRLLVLRLVSPAEAISDVLTREGRIGLKIAGQLGQAVATIHECGVASRLHRAPRPWVLSLPRPRIELLRDISAANVELVRIIQESQGLCRALERLRRNWRPVALIHNDLRLGNCLLSNGRRRNHEELKLADWEAAGLGEPSWDVACVFGDLLMRWVFSMVFLPHSTPARLVRSALLPLSRLQPAMQSFWTTYISARGFSRDEGEKFLLRALRFAGARLIQLAYEWMQQSSSLTGNAVALLQLSVNTMVRPEDAAATLLGIPKNNNG